MTQDQFHKEWSKYKKLIDEDINNYSLKVNQKTLDTYGKYPNLVSETYTDILNRGGKRVRGILTFIGYRMCGGEDTKLILQAARAVEMMHAYMLIIDDIQDRSDTRRNSRSAHRMLEDTHRSNKWSNDGPHTGVALALNAALLGCHGAELVLSNLDVDSDTKIKAINIMNHTMMVTAHGQTKDIVNEVIKVVDTDDIDKVMQWKSAHYSVLNPIHMGMVMAGAPCEDTNAITEYAINIGKAFQITDDLLVVTGQEESGKDTIDDIREGKQTLLTVYALANAKSSEVDFMKNCLGKQDLKQSEYKKCMDILISSGAVDYANSKAQDYVKAGLESLNTHSERWDNTSVQFLEQFAEYLLTRSS